MVKKMMRGGGGGGWNFKKTNALSCLNPTWLEASLGNVNWQVNINYIQKYRHMKSYHNRASCVGHPQKFWLKSFH